MYTGMNYVEVKREDDDSDMTMDSHDDNTGKMKDAAPSVFACVQLHVFDKQLLRSLCFNFICIVLRKT